jgi:serine/threonine-protein kinase
LATDSARPTVPAPDPAAHASSVAAAEAKAREAAAAEAVRPEEQSEPSEVPKTERTSGAPLARSPSFRPGALIADKYVVQRLIGEGGIGVVVAAKHVQLDQMVAIKYLRPKVPMSQVAAERFVNEARLAAKIRSEHVARVYDVGTLPTGAPYIVMEYLSGMDLGRVLEATGMMPVWRAVDYVSQACEALAEAHSAGIVHRDIKPQNLFVTTTANGTPLLKVLDFGISKLMPPALGAQSATGSAGSERPPAADFLGTPVYMSPEQLGAPGEIDARTDVWAIGVVLYQLLCGRLPFEGESLSDLCRSIQEGQMPSMADVGVDLPGSLHSLVEKCLAKRPDDRFTSVVDLAAALQPFGTTSREERLRHALRAIDAVDSGRVRTPVPGELLSHALRAAPVPSFTEDRWTATTGSAVTSWTPPRLLSGAPTPRRKLAQIKPRTLLAGAVALCGAAILALVATRSNETPAAASSTVPAPPPMPAVHDTVVPQAPPPQLPAVPVTATPVATQVQAPPVPVPVPVSVPAAPEPVVTTPSHHSGPHPASPGRHHGAVADTPSAAPPGPAAQEAPQPAAPPAKRAPADPNAVINPFD